MNSPATPDRNPGAHVPGAGTHAEEPAVDRDRVHEQVRTLAAGGAAEIETAGGPVRVVSLLSRPQIADTGETRASGAGEAGVPVLLLRDPAEFPDYFPALTAAASRTTARWWPGPVTVEVDGGPAGLAGSLSRGAGGVGDATRDGPATAATRVRCPTDAAIAAVLELCPAPLVQVGEMAAETLVRLDADGRWSVTAPGPLSEAELTEQTGETIVLVCTGNTCRSPLAEALLRHRLAGIAGPAVRVTSAGLSAGYGAAASPESVDLAQRAGADLSSHQSQPLTQDLLDEADRVLCMTAGHRAAILRHRPDVRDRVSLLDPTGGDIPDPIGGGMADYEACREAIDRGLDSLMSQLGFAPPPERPSYGPP